MKSPKRFESIADKIASRIKFGDFPAGTRLPSERELAESFDVSRVTVRQALTHLQALGKVEVRRGSGAHVLGETEVLSPSVDAVSALELTETRALFESEVAALAAPDISEITLSKLEQLIQEMSIEDIEGDRQSELADREFHLTIARATGNNAIRLLVEKLWQMRMENPAVRRVYDSVCSEDASVRGEEHREILDALRTRDPARARQAMKQHFNRLLESILEATEREIIQDANQRVKESRERYLKSAQI